MEINSWGYSNAMDSGGQAWFKAGVYEPIQANYMDGWGR